MTSPIRPRLRLAATGAALSVVASIGLAGCGEDPEVEEPTSQATGSETPGESPSGSPAESPSESPANDPIQVVFKEGTVSPMGERLEVAVGEPIQVFVTSDTDGTLHVHSTPEQEIEFTEGTSEHEVTLEQPGIVEVESHDPDVVVLQLEAR